MVSMEMESRKMESPQWQWQWKAKAAKEQQQQAAVNEQCAIVTHAENLAANKSSNKQQFDQGGIAPISNGVCRKY